MYHTKIFGGYGKTSTPIEGAWGHYCPGILHEKEEASTPFMILSNGVIARNLSADARFSGKMGDVTVPAFPMLQDISMPELSNLTNKLINGTKDQISAFLDKENDPVKTLIHSTHEYMKINFESTGEAPHARDITEQDFFTQTWPKLQQEGITGFKDLYYRYFIARKPYLVEVCNNIQAEITDIVRTVKGAPRMMKVGYGNFVKDENGLKLVRRPSRYTRFNVNVARLDITVDPFSNTPLRSQAAYIWLLGQQMKRMINYPYAGQEREGIKYYTDADWAGLANSLLLQMSGSGDIKIEKTYTASDIVDQMLHMVGYNIAEAYPFLPQTDAAWEELFEFWLVASLVAARCKATTLMGEINLHSARNAIRAPYDFERYTKPNLENFGSLGQPYYFMARNSLGGDFVLPTVMAYDDQDKEAGIDNDPMERPNIYDILMKKEPIKFTTGDVSRSEMSGNVLEPLADDVFVKLIIHPDSRIQDVEYSMNALRIFRMPVFSTMESNAVPEYLRVQMYLLNLFASGKQNMKEGYFMSPGMGMFSVTKLKTFNNILAQEIVIKDDTHSTGVQMSQPNTQIINKNPTVQAPTAVTSTPGGKMTPNEVAGKIGEAKGESEAAAAE